MFEFSIAALFFGFGLCALGEDRNERALLLAEFPVAEGAGCLAFSAEGELFSSGVHTVTQHHLLSFWDVSGKKVARKITTGSSWPIVLIDYSPNGQSLLTMDSAGSIKILEKGGRLITTFRIFEYGGELGVSDAKFINNVEVLVAPRGANFVMRRNIATNVSKLYYLEGRAPKGATISRRSNAFAWVNDRIAYVWKPMLDKEPGPLAILAADNRYREIACSDDGTRLLCGTDDCQVGLFDLKDKKVIKKWNAHEEGVFLPMIAIKGNKGYITACAEGEVKVWGADGDLVNTLTIPLDMGDCIYCMTCDHESNILALGTERKILLYDLKQMLKVKSK